MIAILYIVVTVHPLHNNYVITSSFIIIFMHACLSLVTAVHLLECASVNVELLQCSVRCYNIGLLLCATIYSYSECVKVYKNHNRLSTDFQQHVNYHDTS